jgi:hypothetical protein
VYLSEKALLNLTRLVRMEATWEVSLAGGKEREGGIWVRVGKPCFNQMGPLKIEPRHRSLVLGQLCRWGWAGGSPQSKDAVCPATECISKGVFGHHLSLVCGCIQIAFAIYSRT